MSGSNTGVIFETDFSDAAGISTDLKWFVQPDSFQTAARDGQGLFLKTNPKTDFWQRTYEKPIILKDDGHLLYMPINQKNIVMETSFEIDAKNKADHAGLMVRLDKDNWVKAGVETVDGKQTLGVVTTNVYSDWSIHSWPSNKLTIRIYKISNDFVVEVQDPENPSEWNIIRILHLHIEEDAEVMMGLMACSPEKAGASAYFHYLRYSNTEGPQH